ncbi:MAG: hypothetical protein RLO21_08945, partial [Nitratireductor sp.]
MATLTFSADVIMTGEAVASQLPGRTFGPADAYRHILLAAEYARLYGADEAALRLTDHEMTADDSPDNGLDFWNNEIGIRIGEYVAANGGGWEDVIRLAREVIVRSFDGIRYDQIADQVSQNKWQIHEAEDGLRLAYEPIRRWV